VATRSRPSTWEQASKKYGVRWTPALIAAREAVSWKRPRPPLVVEREHLAVEDDVGAANERATAQHLRQPGR
jgi:hypothetical protein